MHDFNIQFSGIYRENVFANTNIKQKAIALKYILYNFFLTVEISLLNLLIFFKFGKYYKFQVNFN